SSATASPKAAKKKRVAPKQKPGFNLMEEIKQMVASAEHRRGLSVVAIKKTLDAKGYKPETHKHQVRASLKRLTDSGILIQTTGVGATGSFKLNKDNAAKKPTPRGKKAAAAKKASPRKKLTAKEPSSRKKPSVPKRVIKAKSPAAKKPPKAAVSKKPKSAKKPVKKAVKKPSAPKRPSGKTAKPFRKAPAAKKTPAKKK
uniref:H15 domain-containing protein n=1 Tax=Callorhinchus milii TaxID=7868 RepID=A0A4W3GQ53_CALMI